MSQVAPFAASAELQDITADLEPGCYRAQPEGSLDALAVVYGSYATMPARKSWLFQCRAGAFFSFRVGPGLPPTWVCVDPLAAARTPSVSIRLARTGP